MQKAKKLSRLQVFNPPTLPENATFECLSKEETIGHPQVNSTYNKHRPQHSKNYKLREHTYTHRKPT